MTQKQGFRIEVSSRYDQWWRYNVALMCGCFDAQDNRIGFVAAEDRIAEAGANLAQRPAELSDDRCATLQTPTCDHILLYVYIVPHTLPASKDISLTQPFEVDLRITCNGRKVLVEKRMINQWSGASIELRLGCE